MNHLADKIRADIGSLGVDTSTDTTKHGNHGSSKTVTGNAFCQIDPFLGFRVMNAEEQHGDVKHEESSAAEGEPHGGTGAERSVEAIGPSRFLSRDSGTGVTKDSDLHSEVAGSHGRKGSEQEGKGREDSASGIPTSAPGHKNQDDDRKNDNEPKADIVFSLEERFSTFVNGIVDFIEALGLFSVVSARCKRFVFTSRLALNGDFRDDAELKISPGNGDNARQENQCTGRQLFIPQERERES